MLRDIQNLLKERKRMSLRELSEHFDTPPEALEPMLDQLIRKERVRRIDAKGCAGCFCADRSNMLLYETW